MSINSTWKRPGMAVIASVFALAMPISAAPALAQKAVNVQAEAEARIKKLEAEVKALQRQVFPGGDGKYFPPEIDKGTAAASTTGTPATTPVTDLLTRVDSVESQLSRLTAQNEESANRVAQLEAKLAALTPAAAASTTATTAATTAASTTATTPATTTGATGADTSTSAATTAAQPVTFPKPETVTLTGIKPAATASKPAASTTPAAIKPAVSASAQRVAAVKAVEKPKTADAGDDEYSYGYRLWEAKFYPEAEQQLQLFLTKYPRHERLSYARNLLGRAFLDDAKPRDAAQWFLKNYQADKKGARAPDSLLYLAESMRQLKDTNRACIALSEFGETFTAEASGRLKSQYDATRRGVKCN